MSISALPRDSGAQARALLHQLLENGDVIGQDEAGRTVIQLSAGDWLLEQLMNFDAGSEDLEDSGDAEPDDDAESDVPTVLCFDRVPATRRRHRAESHFINVTRSKNLWPEPPP